MGPPESGAEGFLPLSPGHHSVDVLLDTAGLPGCKDYQKNLKPGLSYSLGIFLKNGSSSVLIATL